jgi:hypothetical protein
MPAKEGPAAGRLRGNCFVAPLHRGVGPAGFRAGLDVDRGRASSPEGADKPSRSASDCGVFWISVLPGRRTWRHRSCVILPFQVIVSLLVDEETMFLIPVTAEQSNRNGSVFYLRH